MTGTPGSQTDKEFEELRKKIANFLKFVGVLAALVFAAAVASAFVGPTAVTKVLALIAALVLGWRLIQAILVLRARGTLTEGVTRAAREPLYAELDREAMQIYAQSVVDAFRRDEQP